jgi:hypothetical protein
LGNIGRDLKFGFKPTMGYARCTAANVVKESGGSIQQIKDMMGHSTTATTEYYLKSLSQETVNKTIDSLRVAHLKIA